MDKKISPRDILKAALIRMAEIQGTENIMKHVDDGASWGVDKASEKNKEMLQKVEEGKAAGFLIELASASASMSMTLMYLYKEIIKDPVLLSYLFFVSNNMTAARLIKAGVIPMEDFDDIGARMPFVSAQMVKSLLECKDPSDTPQMDSETLEKIIPKEYLQNFFASMEELLSKEDHTKAADRLLNAFKPKTPA